MGATSPSGATESVAVATARADDTGATEAEAVAWVAWVGPTG